MKGFVSLFVRKPTIINVNQTMEKKAIFISNHDAVKGPLVLSLYFPYRFIPWGTHEMTEGFFERYHYLFDELYRKKLGLPTLLAWLLSVFFASVAKILYKGVHLIPTYPDQRLLRTLRKSKDVLDHDLNLLIFPENSDHGYQKIMTAYHPGFLACADYYFKKTGIDCPIYTVCYDRKKKIIMIDKPVYLQTLKKTYPTYQAVSDYFVQKTNALHAKYVKPEKKDHHHGDSYLSK